MPVAEPPQSGLPVTRAVKGLARQSWAELYLLYLYLAFRASGPLEGLCLSCACHGASGIWRIAEALARDRCLGRAKIS